MTIKQWQLIKDALEILKDNNKESINDKPIAMLEEALKDENIR